MKEVLLAIQIERNMTKRQILQAYLNQVYFGAGAYRVQTAAQAYFKKGIQEINLQEAALLAGLVQRPSELSPYAAMRANGNYNSSKARRDMVLQRMRDLKFITKEQYEKAVDAPIKVAAERPKSIGFLKGEYFAQHVVDELRQKFGYDEDLLNKAGLTVITTLDWDMQQHAEKVAKAELNKIRRAHRVSEAALLCLDPKTGYIRAMVGGVNEPWEKYQFNCATQARRQPGSSFKAFVYAAAFEAGDTPNTGVSAYARPIVMPDGKVYAPRNHGRARGYTNYRSAFAASYNGAAVNVAVKSGIFSGPRRVKELAQRLGLKGEIRAYPSMALGTSEATVMEMANAYGVFANGGKRAEPMGILQIRSQDGELLEDVQPRVHDTGLKPTTIQYMNELTRAVVTSGTGRGASGVPDAHGKTGTSEDYTDAWFVGYTPELVTAVWAGNRDNSKMARVYGGTIGVPIWAGFMQKALELNPARKAKPIVKRAPAPKRERERERRVRRPEPVTIPVSADGNSNNRVTATVCPESGLLATPGCPDSASQEYMVGDQPLVRCPIHRGKKPAPKEAPKPDPAAPPAEAPAAATDGEVAGGNP
jgi:penicillin-binding protein 1A